MPRGARARLIWYGVAAELLPRMPTPLPTCGKKVGKNPPHNAADFRKYATLFVLSCPSIDPAHLYPYSDICRTCSAITKVYSDVKHHFPLSLVSGKLRFYV